MKHLLKAIFTIMFCHVPNVDCHENIDSEEDYVVHGVNECDSCYEEEVEGKKISKRCARLRLFELLRSESYHEDECALDDVKQAIKDGASLGGRDCKGNPLLFYSVHSCVEVTEFLLKKGAAINSKTAYGETALHHGILHQNDKAVQFLIKSGANINAKNKFNETPLHYLAQWEGLTLDFNLFGKARINVKNKDGQTPLHIAAIFGNVEMVKHLLSKKAKVNLKDKKKNTPIQYAIVSGNVQIANMLINAGSDTKMLDKDGNTTILLGRKYPELVEILIASGVDVNKKNDQGKTVLELAADACQNQTMIVLIANGASDDYYTINYRQKEKSCAVQKDHKGHKHCPPVTKLTSNDPQRCLNCGSLAIVPNVTDNKKTTAVCCECGQIQPELDQIDYWDEPPSETHWTQNQTCPANGRL